MYITFPYHIEGPEDKSILCTGIQNDIFQFRGNFNFDPLWVCCYSMSCGHRGLKTIR